MELQTDGQMDGLTDTGLSRENPGPPTTRNSGPPSTRALTARTYRTHLPQFYIYGRHDAIELKHQN